MKQQPTQKEWNELSDEYKIFLLENIGQTKLNAKTLIHSYTPTIGQMIEFLEDGIYDPHMVPMLPNTWRVKTFNDVFEAEELCDALWEAVKYKLNNI